MFNTITMDEMMRLKDIHILDVREQDEYLSDGYIEGSTLIPLSRLHTSTDQLDKDTPYHVVCYSGLRSQMACMILAQQGYNVINVLGGMSAYNRRLVYEM